MDEFGMTTSRKACGHCLTEYTGELTICPADGAVLTALSSDDLVGTLLDDRYEIESVIGGGGMGKVYKARQRFINRVVAIKVLHKGSISSAETLARFRQEAQAASQLSSAHVVTVFDCNVSKSGEPYMAMDFLDGPSLEAVLETEGRLPPARALNIFVQICEALAKAHSKGIVHRDIKPSNIVLVNEDGQQDFVKIVDFGIAKIIGASESETGGLTRTGEIFGSPLYMSPEQWRGGNLDARTDIYSLGAVMYTTLANAAMFGKGDVMQLAYKHTQEMPLSFKSRGVDLPPGLEAVVFKALAKDVEERFQSMRELGEELISVQQRLRPIDSENVISEETSTWLKHLVQSPLLLKGDNNSTVSLEPEMTSSATGQSSFVPKIENSSGASLVPVANLVDNKQTADLKISKRPLKVAAIVAILVAAAAVGFGAYTAGQEATRIHKEIPPLNPPAQLVPAVVPGALLQKNSALAPEKKLPPVPVPVGQSVKPGNQDKKHAVTHRGEKVVYVRAQRHARSKGVVIKRALSKILRRF